MNCDDLVDRMPAVLAARDTWSAFDSAHLQSCEECAASWRAVRATAAVASDLVVDTAALAASVGARLAASPPSPVIRWRRVALGLAAAAAVTLVVSGTLQQRSPALPDGQPEVAAEAGLFPELAPLSEPALQVLLTSVSDGDTVAITSGAELPRLGDLTDTQLEQLEQLILTVETE